LPGRDEVDDTEQPIGFVARMTQDFLRDGSSPMVRPGTYRMNASASCRMFAKHVVMHMQAGPDSAARRRRHRACYEFRLSNTIRVPVYARTSFVGNSALARSLNGSPEQCSGTI
jgi:hypothetical protein